MSIFNSSICLLSISFIDINSNEEIKKWDQSKLSGPVTILPRIGESIIFFDNKDPNSKVKFSGSYAVRDIVHSYTTMPISNDKDEARIMIYCEKTNGGN